MNKMLEKTKDIVSSRGFTSGLFTAMLIACIVFVNVIASLVTDAFGLYLYTPYEFDFTLSGATDPLFAEAAESGKEVKVTFCMAESDLEVNTTGAYVLETARAFAERYNFIKLDFVNLLTKMDKDGNIVDLSKYLKDMKGNETPLRTHSIIFSSGEGENENYRVVTDGRTNAGFADFYVLNSSNSPAAYIGEEMFGAMVAWVLHKEHKVAYITEGHGETIDTSLGTLLASAGYYLDVINLKKSEADEKLLADDVGMLIISNPTSDFEVGRVSGDTVVRAELDRLKTYLEKGNGGAGGRLYLALDAYSNKLPILEGFLKERGITVAGGEGKYGYSREIVTDSMSAVALDSLSFVAEMSDSPLATLMSDNMTKNSLLLSKVSRLLIENTASSTVQPLLVTSESAIATREGLTVAEGGGFTVAAYSETVEKSGATSGIFVVPTALFSNGDILISNGYGNKEFLYSLFDEAFGANLGIYGTESMLFSRTSVDNLTNSTSIIMTVALLTVPVALAVVGVITLIRRKNR